MGDIVEIVIVLSIILPDTISLIGALTYLTISRDKLGAEKSTGLAPIRAPCSLIDLLPADIGEVIGEYPISPISITFVLTTFFFNSYPHPEGTPVFG